MKYRKVGGIHFVRVGRLQFSFCLCRRKTFPLHRDTYKGNQVHFLPAPNTMV